MSIFKRVYAQKIDSLLEQIKSLEIKLPEDFNPLTEPKLINQADNMDYQILDSLIKLYHLGKIDDEFARRMFLLLRRIKQKLEKLSKERKLEDIHVLERILSALEYILKEERLYVYHKPGAGKIKYIRLGEIILRKRMLIDGAWLELVNGRLTYDNKPVQGANVCGEYIRLKAEHYTTRSYLENIRAGRMLEVNPADPYSYVAEPSKLIKKTAAEVQRILGIKSKEIAGKVVFFTKAPVIRTWINVEKGKPVKFAVEGSLRILPRIKGKELEIHYF